MPPFTTQAGTQQFSAQNQTLILVLGFLVLAILFMPWLWRLLARCSAGLLWREQGIAQASEATLAMAQEAAMISTWDWNLVTDEVVWTGAVKEILGIKPQNPSDFMKLLHPDDYTWFCELLNNVLAGKAEYKAEFRIVRSSDGRTRWLSGRGRVYHDANGRAIRMLGINYDLTDHKEAEQEQLALMQQLEAKTKLLETIIDQMPASIVIAEAPTGKLLTANARTEAIWRRPSPPTSSFAEYKAWTGYHADGRLYKTDEWPITRALSKRETVHKEDITILRGDGTMGVIRVNAAPVVSSNGTMIAGVAICDDVTDLKTTEAELKRARDEAESASRLKSAFLANMSHELRTPITVMMGFAEMLMEADSDEERQKCVEVINRNGQQVSILINDILDLSRVEAGRLLVRPSAFSLRSFLADVVASLELKALEKGLRIDTVITEKVPDMIRTDSCRLRQILVNLLTNAIKFTEQGKITVAVTVADEMLVLDVSDTGIGMPPEAARSLFEPFTQLDESMTRKHGGAGLGLSLTQKLTQLLGGRIYLLHSQVAVGSTFRVEIKAELEVDANLPSSQGASPTEPGLEQIADLRGIRVLVVDDIPEIRAIISSFLRQAGAQVDLACDGADGVEKARHLNPDAIIMDLQMPVLDGYGATRAIRAQGFDKPILALTAHALLESRAHCLTAGFNGLLTKPVTPQTLTNWVAQHCHSRWQATTLGQSDTHRAG